MPGLHVGVFICQQPNEGRTPCGYAGPRREQAERDKEHATPEIRPVLTLRHLGSGEMGMDGGMVQGEFPAHQKEMERARDSQERGDWGEATTGAHQTEQGRSVAAPAISVWTRK